MAAKKQSDPLQEKARDLASAARAVIHELAAKDNSPECYEAARILDQALTRAQRSARDVGRRRFPNQ